ncbi:hypothetical protein OH491_27940 (plasmid) [Termitidicoccus mucosus]|uniref:hypothetical protein n=1 Tax=Termitidicoccus mucosus TaxID=1184151 RepID=UPI0031842EF4
MPDEGGRHVLKMLGMTWTLDEFLTHWCIVQRSGHGKTAGVIRTMFSQLMVTIPNFGCIAIDEKANFHRCWERFARHSSALKNLSFCDHAGGRDLDIPITHMMNFIGDRTIPWDTYAQLVIDTAVACGQKTNNAFLRIRVENHLEPFQTLDAIGITPTRRCI